MTDKIQAIAINRNSIDYLEVVDGIWVLKEHLDTVPERKAFSKAGKYRKRYDINLTPIVKNLKPGTVYDLNDPRTFSPKVRKQKKEKIKQNIYKKAVADWNKYQLLHPSPQIALVNAIQTLNCWVKRDDVREEDRNDGYELKDLWLLKNKEFITKGEISQLPNFSLKENLNFASISEDDDFESKRKMYAYELNIEGIVVRFHSFQKFVDNPLFNPNSAGKSEPLKDEELPEMPLIEFMRLIAVGLGENKSHKSFYLRKDELP